jgi:hypothetical protein
VEEPAAHGSEFLTAASVDSLPAGAVESLKPAAGFAHCAFAAGLNKTSKIAAHVSAIPENPIFIFTRPTRFPGLTAPLEFAHN